MKLENIEEKVEIPEGVSLEISGKTVKLSGEKGSLERNFRFPLIEFSKKEDNGKTYFSVFVKKYTKREKKIFGTIKAHIKNMIKGVTEGHTYKMKICSGHFPMNVSFKDNELIVKNFFGEKTPRTLKISPDVSLNLSGDIITLSGINKELLGQTASMIEKLTSRSGFDKRRFQDGIYIIEKDGKKI